MTFEGSLDVDLFNKFMAEFLNFNSENLFRSKGVLSFEGQERKFVFQVRKQASKQQARTHASTESSSRVCVCVCYACDGMYQLRALVIRL